MEMTNSSWAAVNQGDSPSALTDSMTYSKFFATAVRW
jgi:hypothetical protein